MAENALTLKPKYDLRECSLGEVAHLFETFHGYRSVGRTAVYCFAVWEGLRPVAAYVWQPPAAGAAKAVAPEEPGGVLALSRMVAVPRSDRKLRHVSTPLRRQMRSGLIDRSRWPSLVTYSDEGQGHTGHVYKCSGWTPTQRARRAFYLGPGGERRSSLSSGRRRTDLAFGGHTWIQRWEHHIARGSADVIMRAFGWVREPTGGVCGPPGIRLSGGCKKTP